MLFKKRKKKSEGYRRRKDYDSIIFMVMIISCFINYDQLYLIIKYFYLIFIVKFIL